MARTVVASTILEELAELPAELQYSKAMDAPAMLQSIWQV
jgi:hypothetical protein